MNIRDAIRDDRYIDIYRPEGSFELLNETIYIVINRRCRNDILYVILTLDRDSLLVPLSEDEYNTPKSLDQE